MSRLRDFAQERNWSLMRLAGGRTTLNKMRGIATENEKKLIDEAEEKLILLETEWRNYEKAKSELT